MKIGYLYCSSPTADHPEVIGASPLPGIACIEAQNLPSRVDIAINISILDLRIDDGYALKFDVLHDGRTVPTLNGDSAPFRQRHIRSREGELIHIYSFHESFEVIKSGIYTIKAKIFDSSLPYDIDGESSTDSALCSVAINKEWR